MAPHHNRRIRQLLPADGWWAIYALDDGTIAKERIVAFALCDEWEAPHYEAKPRTVDNGWGEPPEVERVVRVLTAEECAWLDVDQSENLIQIAHADQLPELEPYWPARVQTYLAARAMRAKMRAADRERQKAATSGQA